MLAKETRDLARDVTYARVRYAPSDRDIENGDALNALVRDLTGPKVHPSVLRSEVVRIPEKVTEQVPIQLSRMGVVIAPRRLRAEGEWPDLLRDPALARGRGAYHQAVDAALAQGARGSLSTSVVAAVDRTIDELRVECEAITATAPAAEVANARGFLDRLSKSARMLHQPGSVAALAAILGHSPQSVAELVVLMRRHHLQFGAAGSTAEREVYQDLYPLLVQQADLLVAHSPKPSPVLAVDERDTEQGPR